MTAIAFPTAGLKLLGTLDRIGTEDGAVRTPHAYDSLLRRPAIALATVVNHHLERFAPEYRADPRRIAPAPVQAFRRDRHGLARRTEVAIDFPRRRSAPGDAAAFRVRIGSTGIDVAAGMWHPHPRALARFRAWCLVHHRELETAMHGEVLRRVGPLNLVLAEGSAPRPARSGPAFLEQLLMARELWWVVRLAPSLLTTGDLDRVVAGYFRLLTPCVQLLSGAMMRSER